MKVAISGGTGLIGRALAAELMAHGHAVRILTRDESGVRGLPAGVETAEWDAATAASAAPALDESDAVVQLAGANIGGGRWTPERKRLIRESRVRSSRAIAEALAGSGMPRVLVQGSAVGFYGARGDERLEEDAAPGSDFLGRTCQEWEAASEPAEAAGVRRAVARTGVVLARDGGALPRMALPFKLFAGGPAGSGRQYLPWIHLDDEVAALRFLIEDPTAIGPFNLSAPEPVTNRHFSRELGRVLRRPSFLPVPAFALRLALGEMATLVLDGQRAVPAKLLGSGFRFRFGEPGAALEAIYR